MANRLFHITLNHQLNYEKRSQSRITGSDYHRNRLVLKYQSEPFTAIVGRQDINLINQRHVGTVAWRQNDQTFDAARFQYNAVPGLVLDYTYNWQVN